MIRRVYSRRDTSKEESDDLHESFFRIQKRNTNRESSKVSLGEATCGKKYRRATWTCFFINVFNQGSGINITSVYATRILMNIRDETDGAFPISPFVGAYIIGIANALAAFASQFPVYFLGRKTLFFFG